MKVFEIEKLKKTWFWEKRLQNSGIEIVQNVILAKTKKVIVILKYLVDIFYTLLLWGNI